MIANDYPGEPELERIRNWPSTGEWKPLLQFMESIWPDYGVVRQSRIRLGKRVLPTRWEFVTGGWSGCEDIWSAFCKNPVAYSVLWESSHRGGLHILQLPAKETTDD